MRGLVRGLSIPGAPGGAGGAPTDAEYIVGVANAGLSGERVLTDTATVTWDLTTPGEVKANASSAPAPDQDARVLAWLLGGE